MENKIDSIMVTHKDRFIRFGYEWFERFLGKYDVKIIVVNNETLSPNEELVQDIISILHVFSCKIYGMRKYKKKIEEDEEIAKSIQNGNKSNREPKTKD
jgi:predicted site-specific integrase-resolvase